MSHKNQSDVRLLSELSDQEREEAMARYEVIASVFQAPRPSKQMWQQASEKEGCSERTVRRWVKRFQHSGLAGLSRQPRSDRQRRRAVSLEMTRMVEALYLENGHRSMRSVHRMATAYASEHQLLVSSYTTVRSICQALPASLVYMARQGEKAWRNQYEPAIRFESNRPNECWHVDHCKLDLLVIDPDSQEVLGRPWLTLVLDTYSRAVMGYHLSLEVPNSRTVCLALRQAILEKPSPAWPMGGIPDRLHIDRGKDFTSKRLEQVATDLSIQLQFATPYLARARGKVERLFGTLNDQL